MVSIIIHLASNFVLAKIISIFDKDIDFSKLFLTIASSNLIDIDHLLANPIFDATRCSINFHPLHKWYVVPLSIIGLFLKNKYARYFFLGVLLHLALDLADCHY